MSKSIALSSPFPFEALPRVWAWISPFREKVTDDFSPQTEDQFVCYLAQSWKHTRTWSVSADGELGGMISFEKLTPWVGTAHFLLKQAFHRRGFAVEAARQAAAKIFEQEGVGKLVFHPLAGNLAIGSLLCNLGAQREGTLIGHTLCGGKPTDMWLYGLSKTEFEHASTNHRRGNRGDLFDCGITVIRKAQNHDAIGHQRDERDADGQPGLVIDGQLKSNLLA